VFAKLEPRVGTLVSNGTGQLRIVDNQYLVSFPQAVAEPDVQRFAGSLGARVHPESEPSSEFWLLEFADDPQNIGRHLAAIADENISGALVSGEPNLLFHVEEHSPFLAPKSLTKEGTGSECEVSVGADTSYESCQYFLDRQRVREAWSFIEEHMPNNSFGSPDIRVATIDSGLTFNSVTKSSVHPDIDSDRLGYCYNIAADKPCTHEPSTLDANVHGTASYGIISAKPNNGVGITGIAPHATHISIDGASVAQSAKRYAETLLWVGGLASRPPAGRRGAPSLMPPADVISCSHGLGGLPFPSVVRNALTRLSNEGRNGRGTVLVYSAGNRNTYIGDESELATHPCTIGVGNTELKGEKERRQDREFDCEALQNGSNFSPLIDLCANGTDAPSLHGNPAHAGPDCPCADPRTGVFLHGGTSAAAAMVSAAATLILTINPNLTWRQVRSILCATAKKIDCGNSTERVNCQNMPSIGKWRTGKPPTYATAACTNLPRGLDWFSDWYGYGRLDVYEAVKLAHETAPEN